VRAPDDLPESCENPLIRNNSEPIRSAYKVELSSKQRKTTINDLYISGYLNKLGKQKACLVD